MKYTLVYEDKNTEYLELKWRKGYYMPSPGIQRHMSFIYHCDDGPALEEDNGTLIWQIHGKYHRADGPAYIDVANNDVMWYYKNNIIDVNSQTEFENWIKYNNF